MSLFIEKIEDSCLCSLSVHCSDVDKSLFCIFVPKIPLAYYIHSANLIFLKQNMLGNFLKKSVNKRWH